MITLYGVYRSRASRPLWLLGETGMEFTHVPVIQSYRLSNPAAETPLHTQSPAFLSINPMGQIPVLTDGDLTLTESLAITLYIARRHGGELAPQDEAALAQTVNWTLFAATGIEDAALRLMQTLAGDKAATPEGQTSIETAAQTLRRPFAYLNAQLSGQPYLLGDAFTVADINVAECVRYAQTHQTLVADFPALSAWLASCQARPAFQAMWAGRLAEPA